MVTFVAFVSRYRRNYCTKETEGIQKKRSIYGRQISNLPTETCPSENHCCSLTFSVLKAAAKEYNIKETKNTSWAIKEYNKQAIKQYKIEATKSSTAWQTRSTSFWQQKRTTSWQKKYKIGATKEHSRQAMKEYNRHLKRTKLRQQKRTADRQNKQQRV